MSPEQHKALVGQYYQALSTGDIMLMDRLLAPNYVHHNPVPGTRPDRDGTKQTVAAFHLAFPDAEFTLEHVITEGDIAVGHWTLRGTHQAEWRGVPATHEQVTITGVHLFRIAAGQIVEEWRNSDALGLLQQLHAIPLWRPTRADPATRRVR